MKYLKIDLKRFGFFVFKKVALAVEGATTATKSASNTQTTTQAATTAANANGSVESQYKIKVSGLSLNLTMKTIM